MSKKNGKKDNMVKKLINNVMKKKNIHKIIKNFNRYMKLIV